MGMGFIHGAMGTNTKENGDNALSMEKERIYFQMEISIRDSIRKESLKGRAFTFGPMVVTMKEGSRMA